MTPNGIEGRTALVTGGARGIGGSCCEGLAAAGANVAINYRTSAADAEETARRVEAAGARAFLVQADVSDADEVAAMIAAVSETLGPVDLLVNNAGVHDTVTHEETTLELWQRTLDVNLTGAYLTTWAVKDGMIERGYGRIVNITSIGGLEARPLCIAYAASKAGLTMLTKSLALAIAASGVRVNAVAPGLTDTEMAAAMSDEMIEHLVGITPMGKLVAPSEIADAVVFLLGDQSSAVTGQTLVVSGGRVLLP